MRLSSLEELRADLGFDDMTDINAAISSALDAAAAQLAAGLNTSFDEESVTDTFWVPEPTVIDSGHFKTEFLLSRGFVSGTPTFSGFDVAPGSYALDRERGVIRDWSNRYTETHLQVTYTAGFPADGTDAESYDLTKVPTWLREASKLTAILFLSTSPTLTEAGVVVDTKTLRDQLQSLMPAHLRYAPLALYPI